MLNQGVTFEEVYDKYAIRIILDTNAKREKADIWRALFRDYRGVPSKPASIARLDYRSKSEWIRISPYHCHGAYEGHWIEVQIRSQRMDEEAEKATQLIGATRRTIRAMPH